ncbi:MAG: thioredoxin domain-containing protein [Turneriella sp.]|nr:thioredoxin domain-containing protein [Turneriella sp.]
MNRLQDESSPYLKQHATNPVDWFAWGDEAFAEAKRRDLPILLSIGYSTCHWCHVMEHESFEDQEVAAALNANFVCVKVDREERPDIDHIYMRVCQAMTGQGGWPLTIIMHPDKRPFFAGTYLPKKAVQGRMGLMELAANVARVWQTRRGELEEAAAEIVAAIAKENTANKGELSGAHTTGAFENFRQRYDAKCGGFGSRPKFPSFQNLIFLTRYAHFENNAEALAMVEKTMTEIIAGGISDQIGFGIHRYSTDPDWHLPHFEKMLYDQAMFILALAEIFQKTQKSLYRTALLRTFAFVEGQLKNPAGGYATAYDADSEGEEGKFYVFTYHELREILGEDELAFTVKHLSVRERGNFLDEATHEASPANIFHWIEKPTGGVSAAWPGETLFGEFEPIRAKIFAARAKRVAPGLDDKILTDLNGLWLAALARAALVTGDKGIAAAADAHFRFCAGLVSTEGETFHTRNARGAVAGILDDYAFLIFGFLEYYHWRRETPALLVASRLADTVLRAFAGEDGGFYFTAHGSSDLIARTREFFDGAIPSGNSVMVANLSRLYQLTAEKRYGDAAAALQALYAGFAAAVPTGCAFALAAFLAASRGSELVVSNPRADFSEWLAQMYEPGLAVAETSATLAEKFLYLKNYSASTEAYWLCRNFTCAMPVDSPAKIRLI